MTARLKIRTACGNSEKERDPSGDIFPLPVKVAVSTSGHSQDAPIDSQLANYLRRWDVSQPRRFAIPPYNYLPLMTKFARTAKKRKALMRTGPRTWSIEYGGKVEFKGTQREKAYQNGQGPSVESS